MKAIAAIVTRPGADFSLEEIDVAEPLGDEVVVEIAYSGMCHTDLIVRDLPDKPFPAVLGHEGVGRVVAAGRDVTDLRPDDVVVMSEHFCGECDRCRRGLTPYCQHSYAAARGRRRDGSHELTSATRGPLAGSFLGQSSFATHVVTKARSTYRIQVAESLAMVAPLSCAGVTGAGSVVTALAAEPGRSFVVYGAGAVGLSALLAARHIGCFPRITVDVRPQRLALARRMGATHTIDASEVDPVAAIHAIVAGGADYVVEASGVAQAGEQAVRSLGSLGHCVVAGAAPRGSAITVPWDALLQGQTVSGVVMGSSDARTLLPWLVDLQQCGHFDVAPMTRIYPFEAINDAVRDSLSGEVVKPILRMPGFGEVA